MSLGASRRSCTLSYTYPAAPQNKLCFSSNIASEQVRASTSQSMFLVVSWCPFLVVSNRCSCLLKSTLANGAGSVADLLQKMRGQQAACTALFADLGPDEWCAEFQLETAMLTFKQRLNNCLRVVLDKTTFPPDLAKQVRSCFVVGQLAMQVRGCSDCVVYAMHQYQVCHMAPV